MSDFTMFVSWLWSIMTLFPTLITGSFILGMSFAIFVMRRYIFPLIHKIKN